MQPNIGVGVFVVNREGKFVLGKRQGSTGAGKWALPGGHLEFGETFEACAERELLEETGLQVRDLQFATATNNVMPDVNKHYVTIFMKGVVSDDSAQPQILEPEKCTAWEWVSWDELEGWRNAEVNASEGYDGRRLFLPMLDLFSQRPDFRV
ncbi:hypothetical protein N7492_004409 [Penicillium capsulatum]|uniref:Nudix hydrolase domain-containing protein n=1 Tax=Penicillium capsulatum TaxID=69766 RepID=A0A9W9I7U1_9EURO|nr:hypothetical protein N7492_004409 [Penicillium capsulatum]KAJ6136470.1 hypothetical protein N7512_001630 [Penicillium capsulatum]